MGRPVILSNGSMLVGLNEFGLVHDFYFPYVGQENLTNARSLQHLIGIWVDDQFSWLDDGSWQTSVDFEADALVSKISAQHYGFSLKLEFTDFVDNEYTAFCRQIKVTNLGDREREVRIFMHQVFQISRRGRADTIIYVPDGNYLYDYKGRCALLISARNSRGEPFDQFSIGNFGIEGKEGTFRDAEDGQLDGNLVEHGSVDSVLRCSLKLGAGTSDHVDYWVVASFSQIDAESIHKTLLDHGFHSRLDETRAHWSQWLAIASPQTTQINEKYKDIFKKSMMLVKAHIDKRGGIIASGDSSIYNYGRDYYSYVWPRDGALTMLTLMKLGFSDEPKRFFEFCIDTINPNGYMMHKYQVDKSIGSTWHPLMHRRHPELAIQEDETALVICALHYYLQKFPDERFMEFAYSNLVRPAANFMTRFIDDQTNLPHASYDLWEERFGTHTFTVVVTKAALLSAAEIAQRLNHQDSARVWREAADRISQAMPQLYDSELGRYRKGQYLNDKGELELNNSADTSTLYAFIEFDPKSLAAEEVIHTAETIQGRLFNSSPSGGVVRYEHDSYFLAHSEYLGNPWIICTLWLARYFINKEETAKATEMIEWTLSSSSPSGTLAEQVDPADKHQVGVSPLVWSHAELINTLLDLHGLNS
jgi:glucoamylase